MTTKTKVRVTTTDAEIDAAIARAKTYEQYRPKAIRATYRSSDDALVIDFASGVELLIPRKLLQGLENATADQLLDVKLEDYGSSLHWELLNVDHYVPGLIDGVFGNRRWMSEIGKKGGTRRSAAKAASSRSNGRKGGRPRTRAVA